MKNTKIQRETKQEVMPQQVLRPATMHKRYSLYPYYALGEGKIQSGGSSLADWIKQHGMVRIDGYVGVCWELIIDQLSLFFEEDGIRVKWIRTQDFMKKASEIDKLVAPFLGPKDAVWGRNTTLTLLDFFHESAFQEIETDEGVDLQVIIGVGAGLVDCIGPLVYLDLPKNELLYRMRAKAMTNLGNTVTEDKAMMYKRFYFVDWVVLNKHKEALLDKVDVLVDSQWADTVSWAFAEDLFDGMRRMASSVFRPRPWFDPGVWGGQWMKAHLDGLSQKEENFAWSFEIIAPENGVVFESGGNLLELSFDTFMFREAASVLGRHHEQFGSYFPIRFDFLDTFDGGNLSIQCHPSLSYIQKEFGEKYTQDETYYMLDCTTDSQVYLGFQDDIKPEEFRKVLEDSIRNGTDIEVEKYIQAFRPKKHDLFLIPNQTVHSSGRNNMVLEISATPYIFTFKLYDWMQKDPSGNPRPINIEHGFNNLDFSRKGKRIRDEFIAIPKVIEKGSNWAVVHLSTHADHYYDIHRLEFDTEISVSTDQVCHVLMLVEGTAVEVETQAGFTAVFNYAETFIIPAATSHYRVINKGSGVAKVIKAFVKYNQDAYGKY